MLGAALLSAAIIIQYRVSADPRQLMELDLENLHVALDSLEPTGISVVVPHKMVASNSYELRMVVFGPKDLRTSRTLMEESWVHLRGAGFAIDPSDGHRIEIGTSLPFESLWTVAPKSAGSHVLVLDLSDGAMRNWVTHYAVFYPDSRRSYAELEWIALDNSGAVTIPVQVVTLWGLTRLQARVVQGLLGLVGFTLMCPTIYRVVRRLRGRSRPHESILIKP